MSASGAESRCVEAIGSSEFQAFLKLHNIPRYDITDFEILNFICSGSYGTCYRAKRLSDGMIVALKFFGYATFDPREKPREIEQELEVDWLFKDLGCTAKCYGYLIDSENGYIPNKKFAGRFIVKVSECLSTELFDYLVLMGKIPNDKEIARIFKNIVEAVAIVHRAKYIHRDLKAENIMFDENGTIRLIDFQMVASIPDGCSEVKSDFLFGTASYLAPETIEGKVYSKASDIWQVGIILYILLFGNMPFGQIYGHISAHPDEVAMIKTGTRAVALELLRSILSVAPSDRPTAEEILNHPWVTRSDDLETLQTEVSEDEQYQSYYSIENIQRLKQLRRVRDAFNSKLSETRKRTTVLAYKYYKEKRARFYKMFRAIDILRLKKSFLQLGTVSGVSSPSSPRGGVATPSSSSPRKGKNIALNYEVFCGIMNTHGVEPFACVDVFHAFDVDKNGTIDYVEFMLTLESIRLASSSTDSIRVIAEEEANILFDIFDVNNDGTIELQEFRSVIHHFFSSDSMNIDLHYNDIISIIHSCNDELSRSDFVKFYQLLMFRVNSSMAHGGVSPSREDFHHHKKKKIM